MERLNEDKLGISVQLAVSKTKFQNLNENVTGFKEKLANVTKLHRNCKF